MIQSGSGIILRTRPLTDTSIIVQWLTPEAGRIATVAKGARRPKSPFRGKLDLFYVGDFSFSRSRTSELHTLREVVLRETYLKLRQSLGAFRQACYAASLVEQTTETETPLEGVYPLVHSYVDWLSHAPAQPQLVIALELKMLAILGMQPALPHARLSREAAEKGTFVSEASWAEVARVHINPSVLNELRSFLHGFLIFHLGRIPRNRDSALNPEAS